MARARWCRTQCCAFRIRFGNRQNENKHTEIIFYINFMDVLLCLNLCLNYICGVRQERNSAHSLCLHLTHDKECAQCTGRVAAVEMENKKQQTKQIHRKSATKRKVDTLYQFGCELFCCSTLFFFASIEAFQVNWSDVNHLLVMPCLMRAQIAT